jgi:hypothetical protein
MVNLDTKMIEYRHESYHLWEANIRSILLQNLDCIIFSQDGMFIVNLGTKSKRIIQDKAGITWMLHPLLSCTDLLLEDSNHLLFSNQGNNMVVSIQEQYQDEYGETYFDDIYKLKIQ